MSIGDETMPLGTGGGPIAVVSGRGKTGRAVASALNRTGQNTRVIGRHESRDLVAAFSRCGGVYIIAANMHPAEPEFTTEVLRAAYANGISRIVYHSVAAPYAPAMPHHLGKAHAEDLVRRSGAEWTILQPCAYMQNFFSGIDNATIEVPYNIDRPFGLVHLGDIAQAAATVLMGDHHIGATYELGGPDLVSIRDVAGIAERVLGREITLRQITAEQWSTGPAAELDQREREWLLAMFDYYDRYGFQAGGKVLGALLGRAPRSVAQVLQFRTH